MAKAVPLFSGSKGNSYFIGSAGEGVLIDAGRSCKQIELAMEANGVSMLSVGAVFITHEHIDHCSALRVLVKKYNLPVYASRGTMNALINSAKLEPGADLHIIEDEAAIGNMLVERINTPHDAAESCCYRVISPDGKRALVATDMGYMTPGVRKAAANSDFAVIESNHDVEMLKTGPYPYVLKKRILSDRGHLSNEACASELCELVRSGTLRLMLGHLSEQNNTPEIALRTSAAELTRAGMKLNTDFTLDVAPGNPTVKSVIF
ncbi:MAG TPA: MBL fold metallo-hydrolase [Ruminococcaceae bacterium]|nr:MBL fold metallo-hydrolase [Oscillospiraceae bacterium]